MVLATRALAFILPEHYGADAGGTRFAPPTRITPQNVGNLAPAWTFSTGDLKSLIVWRTRRS